MAPLIHSIKKLILQISHKLKHLTKLKHNKYLKGLIIFLVSLIISLIIIETYIRYNFSNTSKSPFISYWQQDQLLAQSLKPHSSQKHISRKIGEYSVDIKITSQGFRDIRDYQIPKPKDIFRILMLGDSFTFGYGVEIGSTFSKILEDQLNKKYPEKKFEVINAGFASGITWDEAYLFTRYRGLNYHPDLIIENAWVGNDLLDLKNHSYPLVSESGLPEKIISTTTYVDNNGLLIKLPRSEGKRLTGFLGILNESICDSLLICKIYLRPFVDKKILNNEGSETVFLFTQFIDQKLSGDLQGAWEKGQKLLKAINQETVVNNIQFMIVDIPIREQISDPKQLLNNRQLNEKRLENFALANDIRYCDLKPILRESPEDTYFLYDAHLTNKGHQLAAQKMAECIFEYNLINISTLSPK